MGEYVTLALGVVQDEALDQLSEDGRATEIEKQKKERRLAGEELPSTPRQPRRIVKEGQSRQSVMPQGFREEEVREDLQQRQQADVQARLPRQAFLSGHPRAVREADASREAGWRRWKKGEHEKICGEIAEGAIVALQRECEELRHQQRQLDAELAALRKLKERVYKASIEQEKVLEEEVWGEYEQEVLAKQQEVMAARLRNSRRLQRAELNRLRARRRQQYRFASRLQQLALVLEQAAADASVDLEQVHAAYEALDWPQLDSRQQRSVRQVLAYPLRADDLPLPEGGEVSSDESDTDCEEVRLEQQAREQEYARRVKQVCPGGMRESGEKERVRMLRGNERLYDTVVAAAVHLRRGSSASAGESSGEALPVDRAE